MNTNLKQSVGEVEYIVFEMSHITSMETKEDMVN